MEEKTEVVGNNNNVYCEEKIISEIKKIIVEVIETNIPHKCVSYVEPVYNDYSGEVEKITKKEYKQFIEDILKRNDSWLEYGYSPSEFEKLFDNIYIDQWEATYESHHGKNWISYSKILQEKYDEWKYKNFPLWLEEEDDVDLELDVKLNSIFGNFVEKLDGIEFYVNRIFQNIEN